MSENELMPEVMISIRQKWCDLIVSGRKRVEIRKTRPKAEPPFRCFIYKAKDDPSAPTFGTGEVIGEFICKQIMETMTFDKLSGMYLWGNNYVAQNCCLSHKDLVLYGGGERLYAWCISDLTIYDRPKDIREFYRPCIEKYQYCQACKYGVVTIPSDEEEYALYHGGSYDYFDVHCTNWVRRPPQSWCYVVSDCYREVITK